MAKPREGIAERIVEFNARRDPERLELKYRAIRANAFAFLRGTCHLFYEQLPASGPLKNAPLAWVCGDLHLENFGSYKGDNRLVYFDLNDFDESALLPVSWDLVRFTASVLVGAPALRVTERNAVAHTIARGQHRAETRGPFRGLEISALRPGASEFKDTRPGRSQPSRTAGGGHKRKTRATTRCSQSGAHPSLESVASRKSSIRNAAR